jgi:molybdate transport system permease protein
MGNNDPLTPSRPEPAARAFRVPSDAPFFAGLIILSGLYVLLIVGMLLAEVAFLYPPGEVATGTAWNPAEWIWLRLRAVVAPLASPEIRYALQLSLASCTITAILSLWVAVPFGYLMSRFRFPGKALVDAILDIPIVLPPLVIGLALLILFQSPLSVWLDEQMMRLFHVRISVTFAIPSVILAQFAVACAFAVRTMRVTFDQISPRQEQVALTLGCSRGQAFWKVVFPEARRGMVTAATLSWARALGEFGPILVFSGATRLRTEVLPTTVYLELNIGNIETAVAVSMLMILAAAAVLVIVRVYGLEKSGPVIK